MNLHFHHNDDFAFTNESKWRTFDRFVSPVVRRLGFDIYNFRSDTFKRQRKCRHCEVFIEILDEFY